MPEITTTTTTTTTTTNDDDDPTAPFSVSFPTGGTLVITRQQRELIHALLDELVGSSDTDGRIAL